MKFSCFKCGQRLAAEPDMIGRQVDCPVCGSKITVVGEVVETSPAAPIPQPAAPTPAAAPAAVAPPAAPSSPVPKTQLPPGRPAPLPGAPATTSGTPAPASSTPIPSPGKPPSTPGVPPAPANKPAPTPAASPNPPAKSTPSASKTAVSAALAAAAAEAAAAVTAASAAAATPAAKPAAPANKPATPPSPKPATTKSATSKSRAPAIAMVVVLIAALAGGGWYLWHTKFFRHRPTLVKESPITGKPSDPPVDLAIAWKTGQRYQMSLEMSQSCGYRVRTNTAPMETALTQDYAVNVTDATGGNRNLELEILGFTLETTSAGRIVMNFDSLKAASSEGNAVAQALGKLVGGRVRYVVSADNKIISSEGVKELAARAGSAIAGTTATRPVIVARRHFNADGLKQMIELGGPPPGPLRIGTKWTVERDINAGIHGTFRLVTTNTFAGWQLRDKVNCARINITGTVSATTVTGLSAAASAIGSMKISHGKLTGTSWINPSLGVPVETTFNATYDAPVIVPPSRRDSTAETISTTISPALLGLSIKLTEVSPLPKPPVAPEPKGTNDTKP